MLLHSKSGNQSFLEEHKHTQQSVRSKSREGTLNKISKTYIHIEHSEQLEHDNHDNRDQNSPVNDRYKLKIEKSVFV